MKLKKSVASTSLISLGLVGLVGLVAGRTLLAVSPLPGPDRTFIESSHSFLSGDRFVLNSVVSEMAIIQAGDEPVRLITSFVILENQGVRIGEVFTMQVREMDSTDAVIAGLSADGVAYNLGIAPVAGLTWGSVEANEDVHCSYAETP